MKVSHDFVAASAVFDDDHLMSCAGLVPVMTLATQTGLSDLLADKVRIAVAVGAQRSVVHRHNDYLWVSWAVDSIPGVFEARRPTVVP